MGESLEEGSYQGPAAGLTRHLFLICGDFLSPFTPREPRRTHPSTGGSYGLDSAQMIPWLPKGLCVEATSG